jgi:hypothetical protein
MSRDIEMNVNGRFRDVVFALQLDESTDATGKCQVLAFVGFEENSNIIEQFLLCRELKPPDVKFSIALMLALRNMKCDGRTVSPCALTVHRP